MASLNDFLNSFSFFNLPKSNPFNLVQSAIKGVAPTLTTTITPTTSTVTSLLATKDTFVPSTHSSSFPLSIPVNPFNLIPQQSITGSDILQAAPTTTTTIVAGTSSAVAYPSSGTITAATYYIQRGIDNADVTSYFASNTGTGSGYGTGENEFFIGGKGLNIYNGGNGGVNMYYVGTGDDVVNFDNVSKLGGTDTANDVEMIYMEPIIAIDSDSNLGYDNTEIKNSLDAAGTVFRYGGTSGNDLEIVYSSGKITTIKDYRTNKPTDTSDFSRMVFFLSHIVDNTDPANPVYGPCAPFVPNAAWITDTVATTTTTGTTTTTTTTSTSCTTGLVIRGAFNVDIALSAKAFADANAMATSSAASSHGGRLVNNTVHNASTDTSTSTSA